MLCMMTANQCGGGAADITLTLASHSSATFMHRLRVSAREGILTTASNAPMAVVDACVRWQCTFPGTFVRAVMPTHQANVNAARARR